MLEATTEVDPEEKVSASTAARESFFLDFAKAIRSNFPNVLLMVTGGFRTRLGLEYAVKSGACDFVGIGRPAVIEPALPNTIVFNKKVSDEDARLPTKSFRKASLARTLGIKGLGGGTETVSRKSFIMPIHPLILLLSNSSGTWPKFTGCCKALPVPKFKPSTVTERFGRFPLCRIMCSYQ